MDTAPTTESLYKNGSLLVAMPGIMDPLFSKTVILISAFVAEEGVIGMVLNRKLPQPMSHYSGNDSHGDFPLFDGGPMGSEGLMVHRNNTAFEGDLISEGLFMGMGKAFSHLEHVIATKDPIANDARIFVGYAGWTPEQLDEEIKSGVWKVMDSTPDLVFGDPETMWETLSK